MNSLLRSIAAAPSKRRNKTLHQVIFGRRFDENASHRLLILYEPNRISYASVFPFLDYAKDFRSAYGVDIRCWPTGQALERGLPEGLAEATHVLAQTWLTDPQARHERLESFVSRLPGEVTKAYLDSFANNDVRWIGTFPSTSLYFKKSLFKDASNWIRPTYGHTNLTEYYGRLYGLPDEMTDWLVPPTDISKLRVAPNFLTDPELSSAILGQPLHSATKKDLDLHARLGGIAAEGWYGEMRRHAARVVDELKGLSVAKGTGVSRRVFGQELRRSKACFSPFGYGELCWRDIEAIAARAVLIKPDMSHLHTEPDLYRDGETYIACRWDFADLAEKLEEILRDEPRRIYITENAFRIARRYLENAGPVRTYRDLFA